MSRWRVGPWVVIVSAAISACEGPPGPVAGLDERPTNTTCLAPPPPPRSVDIERVFAAVPADFPIELRQAPGGDWYLAERSGLVYRFPDEDDVDAADVEVVVDLRGSVGPQSGEAGMLALALHPDFADNPELFVSYTTGTASSMMSRISRIPSRDGGASFDIADEEVVLELAQPEDIHNGGNIVFGPDGYLYIGFGDGGLPGGDPDGNAQNLGNLYGSVLRIDVDGDAPYAIPADNPFVDTAGARPEIFAHGFRNPWRFHFDQAGTLWLGDVGHGQWEEVDRVVAGGNYGWNVREGAHCFDGGCSQGELIDPVYEYHHDDDGDRSVTAGFVYRGDDLVRYAGSFVFGDWISGRLWALSPTNDGYERAELAVTGVNIGSFAEDRDGELYIVTAQPGAIYRLVPGGGTPLPERIAETGCVNPLAPERPASGLIPYAVAVPFWSDGAEKRRYLALPEGEQIAIDTDGDWTLPPGGVTMKQFRYDGRLVETRFFVRHDDGSYSGYSYAWNEAQTDATLVEDSLRLSVGDSEWIIPSAGGCMSCHTSAANRSLGLETHQLDIDMHYEETDRIANQVSTLRSIGVIEHPPSRGALPATDDDSQPLKARARAYLHVNCAGCHAPTGPARGELDLRYSVPLPQTNLCAAPTVDDLGVTGARVLAPGDRERSVLYLRIRRRDEVGMPPLASLRPDDAGAELIGQWIDVMDACP